jgi:phosphate transport system substrate-binding protein
MIRKRPWMTAFAAAILVGLIAAGCGNDNSPGAGSELSGRVQADGSSTVFPITQAIGEEFHKESPNVDVSVGSSGTGGGFEKFCNGEIDISDASRAIKDEEKQACATKRVEYQELTIGIDGLSVLTNRANTFVDCLTVAELKKIWEPKSKVKNWSQVRSGFPSKPLTLYGPGTDSGTFDFFTKEINGEEDASRSDYTASEDDNVLVTGVAGDKNALGYFGFAYYEQNTDKLRLLGVNAGTGCLKPDRDSINTGTYKPLSRPLFIYVAKDSLSKPPVVAFVDYYLDNVNSLIADVGYVAAHEDTLAKSVTDWEAFKQG